MNTGGPIDSGRMPTVVIVGRIQREVVIVKIIVRVRTAVLLCVRVDVFRRLVGGHNV